MIINPNQLTDDEVYEYWSNEKKVFVKLHDGYWYDFYIETIIKSERMVELYNNNSTLYPYVGDISFDQLYKQPD